MATVVVLTTTGGANWTTPADWNNANNKVEAIGAGTNGYPGFGGGSTAGAGNKGGGGGAYTFQTNLTLTGSIPYTIGATNSNIDTNFNSGVVIAKAAATATQAGGLAASCTPAGNAKSGGNGGNGSAAVSTSGGGAGGAGGAGGPTADGVAGTTATTTTSGQNGGAGEGGVGGAGGTGTANAGNPGSAGTNLGGGVGPGGGGAGGSGHGIGFDGSPGGNAGNYGAGGGAGAGGARWISSPCTTAGGLPGTGAQGVIIITYTGLVGGNIGFILG